MAKGRVATAYVEVRPDTKGFGAELRTKLAAMKNLDAQVVVKSTIDTKALKKEVAAVTTEVDEQSTASIERAAQRRMRALQHVAGVRARYEAEERRAIENLRKARDRAVAEEIRDAQRAARDIAAVQRLKTRQIQQDWAAAIRENKEFDKAAKERANRSAGAFVDEFRDTTLTNFKGAVRQISNGWGRLLANPIGAAGLVLGGSFAAAFALSAGLGATGIAAAVVGGLIVKGEPMVVDAATKLREAFTKSFTFAAQPLVEPLSNALDILRGGAAGIADIGREIFKGIAPYLDDLAESAVSFSKSFGQGVLKALPAIKAGMKGLADLGERLGKVLGDAFAEIGSDPELVTNSLKTLGDVLEYVITGAAEATIGFARFSDQIRKGIRNFESFDKAFTSTVLFDVENADNNWKAFWRDITGETDRAAGVVIEEEKRITEATENMVNDMSTKFKGVSADRIRDVIDGIKKSMGDAAIGTSQFANAVTTELLRIEKQAKTDVWNTFREDAKIGFRGVTQGAKDARDAVDDLIDSMEILDKRFITAEDAADAVADGYDDIAKAIKDGREEGQTFTQWQREQTAALRDQAGNIIDVVKAELSRGKTMAQIMPLFDQQREKWLSQASAILGSRTKAEEYANQLRLTPTEVKTAMNLIGVPEAEAAIKALTTDRKLLITTSADFGSLQSTMQYLAFMASDTGKQSGYDYGQWFASELDKTKEVQRRAGNNAATNAVDGFRNTGKQFGPQAGKDFVNQIMPGHDAMNRARTAGEQAAINALNGAKSQAWPTQQAGVTLSNSFFTGLNSKDYRYMGQQIGLSVANGILDKQGNVSSAAVRMAALIKQNLPASPAEKGPLSGKGDPTYSGMAIAKRLADGMDQGQRYVSASAANLAGQVTLGAKIGTTGMSMTVPGPPQSVVNVFLGTERLDQRVDYRVEENNNNMARVLLAGRSGG